MQNLIQRIRSRDEEQVRIRVDSPQLPQRVNRVGHALSINLDTRHSKTRVRRRGDHRHEVAMFRGGNPPIKLERLGTSRNKYDLIELKFVSYFTGSNQVTVVNRVKCAPHDADAGRRRRSLVHHANSVLNNLCVTYAESTQSGTPT